MVDITIVMEINDMEQSQNNIISLENEIRNIINKVTNSKYTSTLKVEYDPEDNFFILKLGLNCKDATPIVLSFQGNEKDFLIFVAKEFSKRHLEDIIYTKGTLINNTENNDYLYYPIINI